jgi:hypothetical protein
MVYGLVSSWHVPGLDGHPSSILDQTAPRAQSLLRFCWRPAAIRRRL